MATMNAVTVQHESHKSASLTEMFLPSLLRTVRSSILEWTCSFACTISVYTLHHLTLPFPSLYSYAQTVEISFG
jgi:hypothetical protein